MTGILVLQNGSLITDARVLNVLSIEYFAAFWQKALTVRSGALKALARDHRSS
jgi:hypothetical protein